MTDAALSRSDVSAGSTMRHLAGFSVLTSFLRAASDWKSVLTSSGRTSVASADSPVAGVTSATLWVAGTNDMVGRARVTAIAQVIDHTAGAVSSCVAASVEVACSST